MRQFLIKILLSKLNRFFYGGIINFGIKLGLTYFLTELIGMWYYLSYLISLSVAVLFGFFYGVHVVFRNTRNKRKNFIKYLVVFFAIMVLDALFVKIMTDIIGVYYMISIFLVTAVLFFVKYFVYDLFVFKEEKHHIIQPQN